MLVYNSGHEKFNTKQSISSIMGESKVNRSVIIMEYEYIEFIENCANCANSREIN